jgi:hypothetical protein
MGPEDESPCSQEPVTELYPEPAECSPNIHTQFF